MPIEKVINTWFYFLPFILSFFTHDYITDSLSPILLTLVFCNIALDYYEKRYNLLVWIVNIKPSLQELRLLAEPLAYFARTIIIYASFCVDFEEMTSIVNACLCRILRCWWHCCNIGQSAIHWPRRSSRIHRRRQNSSHRRSCKPQWYHYSWWMQSMVRTVYVSCINVFCFRRLKDACLRGYLAHSAFEVKPREQSFVDKIEQPPQSIFYSWCCFRVPVNRFRVFRNSLEK